MQFFPKYTKCQRIFQLCLFYLIHMLSLLAVRFTLKITVSLAP